MERRCLECNKEVTRQSHNGFCRKHTAVKYRVIHFGWVCIDCGTDSTSRWSGLTKSTLRCNKCSDKFNNKANLESGRSCSVCSRSSKKWFYGKDNNLECSSCYRKRYNLSKVKQCNICSTTTSIKWYGNTCRRCYRRNKSSTLRETDPQEYAKHVLKNRLRVRLINALKGKFRSKDVMIKYYGADIDGIKAHLESLFKDGMSWNNYGRKPGIRCWEIDHIVPFCNVDIDNEENLMKVCHYTNLQPLWVEEHIDKTRKDISGKNSFKEQNR